MMLMVRLGGHVTTMTGEEWSKELRPASVIHTRKAGEGEACFLLQKGDKQAKAIGLYCMDGWLPYSEPKMHLRDPE